MLRIPNPGSDISTFIRIYIELYEALGHRQSFDLDAISKTLVGKNLATSCGSTGQKALELSTREDRSRDPLYNQSKMYTELYKVLGWLHPLPDSALTFQFTYLGAHVKEVRRRTPKNFFRECLLGMVYPNAILNIRGGYALRPFATILQTMDDLNGLICRDEMIIGPLCLADDKDSTKYSEMLNYLKSIRGDWEKLQKELDAFSERRGISKDTRENYTRFPIAALEWVGWVEKQYKKDIYGKQIRFLALTSEGCETVQKIKSSVDIRESDLARGSEQQKAALVRLGFYQMLDRAGFDLNSANNQLNQDLQTVQGFLGNQVSSIIFSPFQALEPQYTKSLFSTSESESSVTQNLHQSMETKITPTMIATSHHVSPKVTLSVSTVSVSTETDRDELEVEVVKLFKSTFEREKSVTETVEKIAATLAQAKKDKFYPLVASLFRVIGYSCQVSRPGVNYERWDAFITHDTDSIPIEIKSPTEEEFISIKAVRQALENKVILLARKAFSTRWETTSLAVGYKLPNDRSEVNNLIDDIYKAYNLVIGVIDIYSLLRLVAARVLENKDHNSDELINLRGIINVSDF